MYHHTLDVDIFLLFSYVTTKNENKDVLEVRNYTTVPLNFY